jgi:ParB/RepB/Spo0J family partition protein
MSKNQAHIQGIHLDLLDEPEHALRVAMDDDALRELERDIRENGLYYPLLVRVKADRFEVVDGHRRLVCCRAIGHSPVACIVQTGEGPPPEAVKLKSNLLREDNTDAEIAIWLDELATKHGASLADLCKLVGRSESWVCARTDLLRGDPDVLVALGERKINFSQATVLNRCRESRWRKLGLHFAVADHVPAPRLKEWLASNVPTLQPAQPQPIDSAPVNREETNTGPGVVCDYCGGWKDPHNMVNLWLHRWEWAMVQQFLHLQQQGDINEHEKPARQGTPEAPAATGP